MARDYRLKVCVPQLDPIEERLAKRDRRKIRQSSLSLLLILLVASATLAFIPIRTTLATGSVFLDSILGPGGTASLIALAGSHVTVDAGSSLINATVLSELLGTASTAGSPLNLVLKQVDFVALKSNSITLDLATGQQAGLGILPPNSGASSNVTSTVLEVRIALVSVTLAGYKLTGKAVNRYNETQISSLVPALMMSFDRAFIDLLVDPASTQSTYVMAADMTVYQGLALLFQGILLGS